MARIYKYDYLYQFDKTHLSLDPKRKQYLMKNKAGKGNSSQNMW